MSVAGAARPQCLARLSDATQLRLERHLFLLRKWNPAINLVARATLADAWTRHVEDSVQVFHLRGGTCDHWVDLGSGAGFPGMVVASLAAELAPEMRVTLVEADHRKAEFLRTVSRETETPVTILDSRIEDLPPQQADIVSARALAPLATLCAYAEQHMRSTGRAVFLKGARAEDELRVAWANWQFDAQSFPSITDPAASVLVLTDLHRV